MKSLMSPYKEMANPRGTLPSLKDALGYTVHLVPIRCSWHGVSCRQIPKRSIFYAENPRQSNIPANVALDQDSSRENEAMKLCLQGLVGATRTRNTALGFVAGGTAFVKEGIEARVILQVRIATTKGWTLMRYAVEKVGLLLGVKRDREEVVKVQE